MKRCLPVAVGSCSFIALALAAADPDPAALKKAVTFYASFDEAVQADVAGGQRTPDTRVGTPGEPGKYQFAKGFDAKVFTIAKGKGIAGGALDAVDVLPNNGRIYFPMKGNLAYKKDGWGGALSMWINTDPNTRLKTKFCDPVQITQKGANNGGLWFDFNDKKPRDLRMGVFAAVPDGKKGIGEDDPDAPMVRVPRIGFKDGEWHHVVMTWKNLDTGKANAHAALYIDGKQIGDVKDRPLAMEWDVEKAGIYVAVNYIGLIDELALFDRPLTADEVALLKSAPALLQSLKKAGGAGRLLDTIRPKMAGTAPAPPKFPFAGVAARQYQSEYAAWLGVPVEVKNALGMEFMLVPPGTFLMGSPADEPGRSGVGSAYDETPRHAVTLTRPLYLSKHETTVGQFRRFIEATGYVTDGERTGGGNAHDDKAVWKHRPGTSWRKPGYAGPYTQADNHPVVHVSHADALAFCKWLNDAASLAAYGLPTEAQWEWACRAGSATRFWWGPDEDTTGKVANVGDRSLQRLQPNWPRAIMPMDDGHAFPAPVGSYRANGFGLHDMLGNVWEFCATRYGPYPRAHVTDPGDIDPKRGFAVRGGGWSNVAADCRCATRNADPPHFCHSNLGFRVALRLP